MKRIILIFLGLVVVSVGAFCQEDRRDVRAGNRKFRKDKFKESEIDYRKAMLKDSTSVPAAYNLGSALYREQNYDEALKSMESVRNVVAATADAAAYHFNAGDMALQKKDYGAAVQSFRESLLLNPSDMQAKENYIYAKKMLENQQNQDQQNQQNQQNQDQQDKDQNQQEQQNQQDQQNKDQNQPQGQQPQQQKISPQQAGQMLKAIQAREKETQDKVNKEKAAAVGTRQREKNW